jgi:subtilisin family serine protease
MKVWRGIFSIVAISILWSIASVTYSSPRAPYVRDELLVRYKESASPWVLTNLENSLGLVTITNYPSLRLKRLRIVADRSVEDCINEYHRLAADEIEYVEPNYLVTADIFPNDPEFSDLYALHNTGQEGGVSDADIDAVEAWDLETGNSIIVAVIDTGVDYNHPDLAANIWVNGDEIPGNGVDDDHNGYTDDYHGWDFCNDDNDPWDDYSHGTHCAGIIAAVGNNNVGVTGVNWHAKIMPLKFMDSNGGGSTANAVSAILYASRMGAKVISNSWGGGGFSNALKDAIETANGAGTVFVAAAGNSARDNDLVPHYPSSYDCGNIIAVAATDGNDTLAPFSCYGLQSVDVGAPGVSILSTVPGGSYANYSGTSMATPYVAGAVALAMAHSPSSSHTQIVRRVLDGAEPLSSLEGRVSTGGRLNLMQTLNPENDTISPAGITDLSLVESRMAQVTLRWTSTGDDGNTGKASSYDLRYSQTPITDSNWETAKRATGLPLPQSAGGLEEATVTGLAPDTFYHFAVQVKDNRHNSSAISNVVTATTSSGTVVMHDDAENGENSWFAEGLWHQTNHRASSGTCSWYYGRENAWNYDTGEGNSGTLTSGIIDLSAYEDAVLLFNQYREVESYGGGYDMCSVEASDDGGVSWEVVWQMGSSSPCEGEWGDSGVLALSDFAGRFLMLRFTFDTVDDSYNDYEGWYVDDIRLIAEDYNDGGGKGGGDDGEANPSLHTVTLMLNKEKFRAGDVLFLKATVMTGVSCPSRICDAYLAVSDPAGRLFYLDEKYTCSTTAAPFVRRFHVKNISTAIGPLTVPTGIPEGEYSWFAVLTPASDSPLRAANWMSTLGEAPFTLCR